MLFKITVSLKTESGNCLVTLPRSEHKLDKILSTMKIFTVNKNKCLFPVLSNINGRNLSIDYGNNFDKTDRCGQMLEFLNAAGAHSAILHTVQQGNAIVDEVNILEVYSETNF